MDWLVGRASVSVRADRREHEQPAVTLVECDGASRCRTLRGHEQRVYRERRLGADIRVGHGWVRALIQEHVLLRMTRRHRHCQEQQRG